MTKPMGDCYSHASCIVRRMLRIRTLLLPAVALAGVTASAALAPMPAEVAIINPLPIVGAALPCPPPVAADDHVDRLTALESALDECSSDLSQAQRRHLARIIADESAAHGYDPFFIAALVQVESGCSATARGGGALGLVQLLPATARGVARRAGVPWRGQRTLTEPSSNIRLGLHYLKELEDQLGDPYRAVAAYNLGPARVARMSSRSARRTRYVRKIVSRYERLLDQHA